MATTRSAGDVGSRASGTEWLLLVNSTIAFAIALPTMITIHELAHGLAGVAMGLHPTVYPGQVIDGIQGTMSQQVAQLLAGPIGSLVIGVAILLVAPAARGFPGLFLLWLGALSVQEFTGYLMTSPFLAIGDVGAALHLLGAPFWVSWLLLVAGALGTGLLGRHFTRRLETLIDPAAGDRSTQLRSLGLFEWLLGVALTFAYNLVTGLLLGGLHGLLTPVGLVETLAILTSGIFVFWVRFFMSEEVPEHGISVGWAWPAAGVLVFLLVSLARTFIFGPGLQL